MQKVLTTSELFGSRHAVWALWMGGRLHLESTCDEDFKESLQQVRQQPNSVVAKRQSSHV